MNIGHKVKMAVMALALITAAPFVAGSTVFEANSFFGNYSSFALERSSDLFSRSNDFKFGVVDGEFDVGEDPLLIRDLDRLVVTQQGEDRWTLTNSAQTSIDLVANAFSFVFFTGDADSSWETDVGIEWFGGSTYSVLFNSFPINYSFLALNVTPLATPLPPSFALFGSAIACGAMLSRRRNRKSPSRGNPAFE